MQELGESRSRIGESEKMTINLGVVDLGQVDLLVQEGFYANRSDLVRTAVRNQLARHAEALQAALARRELVLGLRDVGRGELERAQQAGVRIAIHVVGLARIAPDVSPELARATIESITVLGSLQAPKAVREALAGRIH